MWYFWYHLKSSLYFLYHLLLLLLLWLSPLGCHFKGFCRLGLESVTFCFRALKILSHQPPLPFFPIIWQVKNTVLVSPPPKTLHARTTCHHLHRTESWRSKGHLKFSTNTSAYLPSKPIGLPTQHSMWRASLYKQSQFWVNKLRKQKKKKIYFTSSKTLELFFFLFSC